MKRSSLALVLSFASAFALADVFPAAALDRYANDPSNLMKDPRLSCHLKTLLGSAGYKKLVGSMSSIELRDKESNGAYPFVGSVPGLGGVAGGFVLVHPDGRLWVAYRGDKDVPYFTNDPAAKDAPPKAIVDWAGADAKIAPVPSASKDFEGRVAIACPAAKTAMADGGPGACDDKSPFSEAAVVVAEPKEKVPFGSGKSYLLAGDVVGVTKTNGDETCAVYRRSGAKDAYGTVATKSLSVLEPSNPLLAKLEKEPKKAHAAWAGEWWRDDHTNLTVLAPEGQGLVVSGSASNGANVGKIEKQALVVSGAKAVTAKDQAKDAVVCAGLTLYRFKNALYATEGSACGGAGVSFEGAYFKNTAKRSRKK